MQKNSVADVQLVFKHVSASFFSTTSPSSLFFSHVSLWLYFTCIYSFRPIMNLINENKADPVYYD